MPDLAETWTNLARDEHIAMRQSPWATSSNPANQEQRDDNHHRRSQQDINVHIYPPF